MAGQPIVKQDGANTTSAIAEAVGASAYDAESLEDELSTFDEELPDGLDGTEGTEPSTAQTTQVSETQVEVAASDTAEVPDSYWGADLTGIPAEKKAEIIAHFEQQDSTIRKLQERLATPLEREAPEPQDVSEPTDEELLQVLGLDPELTDGQERNALVMMARNQLALEARVEQLSTVETGRAVENSWSKQLTELETTYGELPGSREQQLRYAAEEGIVSPADLYFKLSAPVKKEVEGLAAAARRDAEKRVQSGGLKPRSSAAEPATVQPGMSLRDAVKASAAAAQKETGLSWKQAVKRVLTSTPGDEKQ
jgi:hypothetical protein